jgi:hypothetical protein
MVVLVGSSLVLAGPAVAAERPPKVTPKDLPFTAAVAAVYPDLEGGSRFLSKQAKSVLLRSTEDCNQTVQVARADRGTRADFFLAGDLDPLEQGVDDPTVSGFRFPTSDPAVRLMADVADYTAACAGEHAGPEDHTTTLTRLQDPDLGDEAVAMAVSVAWPGGGYQLVDVLVRDGLSVSRVQVKRADGPPDPDAALDLAALALDRLAPGVG